MPFPRRIHYPNGTTLLVRNAEEEAAAPPGWRDNPGMFLPPDHFEYVPPSPPEPPAPEPPTVIEYENEPIPIIVLEDEEPEEVVEEVADDPVAPVRRKHRKKEK